MTSKMVASRSTMSAFCMITFKQFLLTLGRERKKSSNVFHPHLPKNLENSLEGERKVQRVVEERNKTAVKHYFKRISATSFGSILFSASRKSFDKNIELFLATLDFHEISTNNYPSLYSNLQGVFGFLLALLDQALPSTSHAGIHRRTHECLNRCESVCCIFGCTFAGISMQ